MQPTYNLWLQPSSCMFTCAKVIYRAKRSIIYSPRPKCSLSVQKCSERNRVIHTQTPQLYLNCSLQTLLPWSGELSGFEREQKQLSRGSHLDSPANLCLSCGRTSSHTPQQYSVILRGLGSAH